MINIAINKEVRHPLQALVTPMVKSAMALLIVGQLSACAGGFGVSRGGAPYGTAGVTPSAQNNPTTGSVANNANAATAGKARRLGKRAKAWSYRGPAGPENWAGLHEEYNLCSSGKNQSPIRVEYPAPTTLQELFFDYGPTAISIENDGRALRVRHKPGSTLWLDSSRYELQEYHFHAPGEHIIDGQAYPLEAHLVHKDKNGRILVVAVFYGEGDSDPQLDSLIRQLPPALGQVGPMQVGLTPERLLPRLRMYYRYNGSLTTPPCTEGVRWVMLRQPMGASKWQLQAMRAIVGGNNARPVQPVFARRVLEQ